MKGNCGLGVVYVIMITYESMPGAYGPFAGEETVCS